jgi:hypothetical protein
MNFFRVGVVDFFGILCPGILLLINLSVFLFACNLPIEGMWSSISTGDAGIVVSLLLFVICYLFGFILRLISPDLIDRAASFLGSLRSYRDKRKFYAELEKQGKLPKRKTKEESKKVLKEYYDKSIEQDKPLPSFFWREERYPYYYGTRYLYNRNLSPELGNEIMGKRKYHNKNTYNLAKTYIASKDPNLATLVFQAEAFVRFMSGAFWALSLGIVSGVILIISDIASNKNLITALVFTAITLTMMMIILARFKNQRRREVKILIDAMLIVSGKNIYLG